MTESTPAPRISSTLLRQASATSAGVVVQSLTTGDTWALPRGLSKTEALDGDLCVVLPSDEVAFYLAEAGGNHAKAARIATAVLRWEIEMTERRLTAAARNDQ